MYRCKYFKIEELVHPNLLKEIPEDILWMILDPNLLKAADIIRNHYGPSFVNDKGLVDCGLREINSKTGAIYSAHKFGRALDLHITSIENKNLTKEEKIKAYNRIRSEMLDKISDFRKKINQEHSILIECLNFEDNISWLHIDTFNRKKKIFLP